MTEKPEKPSDDYKAGALWAFDGIRAWIKEFHDKTNNIPKQDLLDSLIKGVETISGA